MAATQKVKDKYEGKAAAEVKRCKAAQMWPLWADFCNIHEWFPNLASCTLVEGVVGNEVGSVRYCVGEEVDGRETMWAKERLMEMEHEKRLMRYEVLENSVGLKGYVAEIRVYDKEEEGGGGCMVEWWFKADTVDGWEEEVFHGYVQSSLEFIVKKMEEAVRSGLT